LTSRCILVTGGAGFIGSAVCRLLVGSGYQVINLDKLTYAASAATLRPLERNPRHRFVKGDIGDMNKVMALLQEATVDAVINLAAESHVDRSIDAPAVFVDTNICGTFNLLRVVREYLDRQRPDLRQDFRFIHVSTDEVYGSLGPAGQFNETSPYDPHSPYAASKAGSDHLVSAFCHTYGLPAIITNCSNNYGPYQFPEKLIPLMIINAIEHKPLPVYGQGLNVRDWLFVEDHANALQLVLERGQPGEKYNIGAACERRNIDLVHEICALLASKGISTPKGGFESLITFVTDRPGHDLRYAIDAGKVQRELGWRPTHTLAAGLSETIDWYLTNEDWWRPIRENVYAGERLGTGLKPSEKSASWNVGKHAGVKLAE
jgi:dTDP-glucose 4,6-dehydratase